MVHFAESDVGASFICIVIIGNIITPRNAFVRFSTSAQMPRNRHAGSALDYVPSHHAGLRDIKETHHKPASWAVSIAIECRRWHNHGWAWRSGIWARSVFVLRLGSYDTEPVTLDDAGLGKVFLPPVCEEDAGRA